MAKSVKREEFYDVISGIMIMQMILLHVTQMSGTYELFYIPIHVLSFFMPWFFFKSGVFFNYKENIKNEIRNSWNRLMIPFFVFGFVGAFIFLANLIIFHGFGQVKEVLTHSIQMGIPTLGNAPLWYLLSLFVIRVTMYCTKKISLYLILFFSFAIPYYMYISGNNSWLILAHTLLGLNYFICGYKLRDIQFNKKAIFIAALIFTSCLIYKPSAIDFVHNSVDYGSYLLDYPYSLSSIILINNLFKFISKKGLTSRKLKTLGRDSMSYLVTHMIILVLSLPICSYLKIESSIYITIFMVLVLLGTLPIINKCLNMPKLKWMIGVVPAQINNSYKYECN